MSNFISTWDDEEEEPRAPFLLPFLFAMLMGIPASGLSIAAALYSNLVLGILVVGCGALCGIGGRIGEGDFFPAFLATILHLAGTISLVTAALLVRDLDVSPLQLGYALLFEQGAMIDFANDCVTVAGKTFLAYPVAIAAAYAVGDHE